MEFKRGIGSISFLLLGAFLLIIGLSIYFLHSNVQGYFQHQLEERLRGIAQTASVSFTHEELSGINSPDDIRKSAYKTVVNKLVEIRRLNPNIRFAYILRQTEDVNTQIFVADADSINPYAAIDLNKDGEINDEDALAAPGDEYDVSEQPPLRDFGFTQTTISEELEEDQWGTFLSVSAPIFDNKNQATELVGLDVDVSDYIQISNLALVPFIAFTILLLVAIIMLTSILVRMWSTRVRLLSELDRQKDELLSIVSHQLAAPVTAIKWYLESLLDDPKQLDESQKADMKSMQSITEDLSDLVSMILDVSRIQLGKMKVDVQPLDVGEFFHEILQVIEPKTKEKPVNFIKSIPEKLPIALLDKRLTRMTVENLLTNAVKYTPKDGNVWFTVTLDEKNLLSITVKDTGVGIPKADQGKIFGKQFRASNVRNAIDGNGFGLYVAKGAIEGQDGKIWFESQEGKGTTFYVQVPLKFPDEAKK